MIASGTDTATASEEGDGVTGLYTRDETGTDVYTLDETGSDDSSMDLIGGSFSQSVSGTDSYAVAEDGNCDRQTYDPETTGGGTWTRVTSGSGATLGSGNGTNRYTVTESGDALAGHFATSDTGTHRYELVDRFEDVSNTDAGRTPGNVTFHSHGLVWRDPTPEQELRDLARAIEFRFGMKATVVNGKIEVHTGLILSEP